MCESWLRSSCLEDGVPRGPAHPGRHCAGHTPGAQTSPRPSGGMNPRRAGEEREGNQVGPGKIRKQPWPPWAASLSLGTLEILALVGISAGAFYEGERNQICNWGVGNSLRGPARPAGQLSAQRRKLKNYPNSPRAGSLTE